MLTNLLANYRAYINGRQGAEDGFEAGSKELRANYAGQLLTEKMEALRTAYEATKAALRDEYIPMFEREFADAKAEVRRAVTKAIPDDVAQSLRAFEGLKLSDAEKTNILEMTKHSYLARRRAVELLHVPDDEIPPSADTVMENIEFLEKLVMGTERKALFSYDVRLLTHGNLIEKVRAEATGFTNTYSA